MRREAEATRAGPGVDEEREESGLAASRMTRRRLEEQATSCPAASTHPSALPSMPSPKTLARQLNNGVDRDLIPTSRSYPTLLIDFC